LVAVWHALDHYGAPTLNFKHIVRLLMLTGQRESEISNLIWREVADTALLLPATRTKNKRPHAVPLTAPALAILAEPRRGQGDDFIFRSYGKATAFASWGTSKRRLDEQLATDGFELAPWRIHDLRRSVATHMGELGVMPHVIEAVLNHISGSRKGVAGVYNRSTLEPQKRAALELWAEHLMAHVEGREHEVTGKVLPFRA
jgi:integrase